MERTVYAVDIFLMQHIMWEVHYNKIATFRYMNICPCLRGVYEYVSLTVHVDSGFLKVETLIFTDIPA
jgi:hypothetical protein